jgi:hypothetical protein
MREAEKTLLLLKSFNTVDGGETSPQDWLCGRLIEVAAK